MKALIIATQKSDRLSSLLDKMGTGSCACVPEVPAFSGDLARLRKREIMIRPLALSKGSSVVLQQFNAGNLLALSSPDGLTADYPGLTKVVDWDVETVAIAEIVSELPHDEWHAYVDVPGQTSQVVRELMQCSKIQFKDIHFVLSEQPLFPGEKSLLALEEKGKECGYQILGLADAAHIHGHYYTAHFNVEADILRKELAKATLDLENLRDRFEAQTGDYEKALIQLENAAQLYEALLQAPPETLRDLGFKS